MSAVRGRIWFKEEMMEAILDGRKTSTTRDHSRAPGLYTAVIGDYYRAKPFATIRITGIEETTWGRVFEDNWKEEGFNSPGHMKDWCKENGIGKSNGIVFLHRFVRVEVPSIVKASEDDGT